MRPPRTDSILAEAVQKIRTTTHTFDRNEMRRKIFKRWYTQFRSSDYILFGNMHEKQTMKNAFVVENGHDYSYLLLASSAWSRVSLRHLGVGQSESSAAAARFVLRCVCDFGCCHSTEIHSTHARLHSCPIYMYSERLYILFTTICACCLAKDFLC